MRTECPGRREDRLLQPTGLKYGKYIHGACFCNRLTEHLAHFLVTKPCGEAHCVVQPEFEPARSVRPCAYLVAHGKREALAVGVVDVWACRGEGDVEGSVRRCRDAETSSEGRVLIRVGRMYRPHPRALWIQCASIVTRRLTRISKAPASNG